MEVLGRFDIETLDIVQKIFETFSLKIYIRKYFKKLNTCYNSKFFNSFCE